ncbi:MAG: efflux RND transporter periplasmic adaptor subunit, partial [Thermogutta sp.]|uniref:efflux RND transporter periplasmic adaptor subunit n=1 Tax=Thermogutta sp. TaxID=1962930 RepID=UPI0019CD5912
MNVQHLSSESMVSRRDQETHVRASRRRRTIRAILAFAGFFLLGMVISAVAVRSGAGPGLIGHLRLVGMPTTPEQNDSDHAHGGWCAEHHVPEELCLGCSPQLWPKTRFQARWCKKHRVPECPLCHPEIAELSATPSVLPVDFERASRESDSPINPECTLHQRMVQVASVDVLTGLGVEVAPVTRGVLREALEAQGRVELGFGSTVCISAPFAGMVRHIARQEGDSVKKGDLLLKMESAEVAGWRADGRKAAQLVTLRRVQMDRFTSLKGLTVAPRMVDEALALWEQACAEQWISREKLNWVARTTAEPEGDLCRTTEPGLTPSAMSASSQHLLPDENSLPGDPLLSLHAPMAGRVLSCFVGPGQHVVAGQALMTVGDPNQLMLTVWVRPEDASRIRRGQQAIFRHSGHVEPDRGEVVAVSPLIDERTRLVAVWTTLDPTERENHVGTVGWAEILIAEERDVIMVPESAVHWEGDCFVVFVRDRDFDHLPYKVFHVRKVRIGRKVWHEGREMREIVAGLLPGEVVATTNSFVLR